MIAPNPIVRRRNRLKFVLDPTGEFIAIPAGIDRSELEPESIAAIDLLASETQPHEVSIHAIAKACLGCDQTALVAVWLDSKSRIIGSTLTTTTKGITPATFRAALRSLPARAKYVHFASATAIDSETRDAATTAAECFLVRVLDYLMLEPNLDR